jgi:hypothetical protein
MRAITLSLSPSSRHGRTTKINLDSQIGFYRKKHVYMVRIVHIPGDMIRRIRQHATESRRRLLSKSHKLSAQKRSQQQDLLIGDGCVLAYLSLSLRSTLFDRAPTRQDDAIHHRRYYTSYNTHNCIGESLSGRYSIVRDPSGKYYYI